MTTFVFDGTFEGLLTSIFGYYERKPGNVQLIDNAHFQPTILGDQTQIISDETKSKRVWDGLKKKISKDWQQRFYKADFNVLPLIADFFKNRYADQKWIIYDLRRKYGLYYDLEKVEAIQLDHAPELKTGSAFLSDDLTHDKEHLYGLLWNDYFRSTNIPARKNMKLHIRHVPKRYWKYLTEKQDMEKLFFIAIVPPKALADAVTAVKQDFADRFESHRALRIIPHITLQPPFKLFEGKRKGLLEWFEKLNVDAGKFEIALNGFGAFNHPKNPVVFIQPEASENLNKLQRQLIERLSNLLPKQIATDGRFHPHMTVAYRDLTPENFRKAWAEYESKQFLGTFEATAFHLLEHDGTKWNIVATKNL
jgi:2'-5' RNA ligase